MPISGLPKTLKLIFKLAPRQLADEIARAKAEVKRKGIQLGTAAAFLAVAVVFIAFLVTGLIVAAIMGLATIMPAWLAALLVCAVFLVIALIVALVGLRKFKKAMPLLPAETVRGLKHDLGIAKEGTSFDAKVLQPGTTQYKAAQAAKDEADAKKKAEKEAKAAAGPDYGPPPSESELRRRLNERRNHLASVRDELDAELDLKTQGQIVLAAAQARLQDTKDQLSDKVAGLRSEMPGSAKTSAGAATDSSGLVGRLGQRWQPLAVLTASTAALVFLLRKLVKG